ncbi:alanyl-tRNA editing protein [Sutcliffiella horikoshii]|uniref:Alanyl-tRNA editing protein n=1 Tax=Sutcliffiella horikoshii TaxID=79883 RepID=A0ABN4ZJB3_9BACI|nr:DHHA1 domain-containing protein [Sutcliffiella horikoshii]ART77499.1 alanyl-tRNA editing protein [Sutcliffiella horikoshii]
MEKLFYQDPFIQTFTTTLSKQSQDESGKWYAVLEQTAFYPEGGGQPYDTGTLNEHKVLEVQEINGEIRHYLGQPLPESIKVVKGTIDWERRYDHMQQHAGQHLLSAAFEELFSYKTKSFHLGKDVSTIDLDTTGLTEQEFLEAETLVNKIILENRKIEAKWVTKEELSDYPLRKELSVSENIRLVIIPDFDYNGCGGTHPHSTGGVASLKILSLEKQKNMIRVSFVAGNRVLKQLHEKQQVLSELSSLLNAPQNGMSDAVTRMLGQSKEQAKELKDMKGKLLEYEVAALVSQSELVSGRSIIKSVLQNREMAELQSMARKLVSTREDLNVFLIAENTGKLQFVGARGSETDLDLKFIAKEVFAFINGKGGGREDFVQGGGETTLTGEEVIERIMLILSKD